MTYRKSLQFLGKNFFSKEKSVTLREVIPMW